MKSITRISIGVLIFIALVAMTWTISNNGLQAQPLDEFYPSNETAQIGESVQVDIIKSSGIEVEEVLLQKINADNATGYMIYFGEKADLSPAYAMNWEDRGEFVVKALQTTAEKTQTAVRAHLDAQGAVYQLFWIDNIIIVESSNIQTFNGLMSFPEIESLKTKRTMQVIEPIQIANAPSSILAIEPNISHVQTPAVWALGYSGAGMVVANIDTGVRYTHEVLDAHYRGNLGTGSYDHDYNWLDPDTGNITPVDDHGHGSHTMGTMIGDDNGTNQVGMAPDAEWIACDACNASTGCPEAALLTCAQWVTAPYPIGDPGSADPNMRPHVVNNSWGDCGTTYDNWYEGSITAWHASGIYPVFSNGNSRNCSYSSPPGLNTVGNPARSGNVTGVGSTGQSNGLYATHSNWGPTDNLDTINPKAGYADLKPQVMAPGVNIRSSVENSDSAYESWAGTSMSAPHVTALVALMWQAAPCLVGNYADTETILEDTAIGIPYDDGTGGGVTVPNQATGWGEINALAAVEAARDSCGAQGSLTGLVDDGSTGIAGAMVTAVNITNTINATTDANGYYTMTLPVGEYDAVASAYGYVSSSLTTVTIVSGTVTTQNFTLALTTMYTVGGIVTDINTGWPLYASIDISGAGYPGVTLWTDPETGAYSIDLVGNITYTLNAEAWVEGYLTESSDVYLTANTTEDIALDVNIAACTAPGYNLTGGLFESFDATIAPAGWTIVDNDGAGHVWAFDNPGERSNNSGGSGNFAIADSDDAGFDNSMDTELRTPVVDFTGITSVTLAFKYDFNWYSAGNNEIANADVSNDGGATWSNVWTRSGADDTGSENIDISALAGNQSAVMVRFHYYDAVWEYWLQIDDFILGAPSCDPSVDGGLLVGNVYDENTLDALNGAEVASDGGEVEMTFATLDDTAVDDGFFTIFSPSASHTFTATMNGGYGANVQTLTITNGDTVSQVFELPSTSLSAAPTSFYVTVSMGDSVTSTLMLNNISSLVVDFELTERNGGYISTTILSTEHGVTPITTVNSSTSVRIGDNVFVANLNTNMENVVSPSVFRRSDATMMTHSVSQLITAANSISCNTDGFHADNGYLRTFTLNDFGIDGDFGVTAVEMAIESASSGTGETQPVTVNLYTLNGALSWANLTLIGTVDTVIADADAGTVVSIPVTGIAPAGSTLVVEFFTPDGQTAGHSLFIGSNAVGQTSPAYLAAVNCGEPEPIDIGSLGFPDMHIVMNVVGDVSSTDIIWLSESSITGTIDIDDSIFIDLVFDASVVTQTGNYTGTLSVVSDGVVDGTIEIPVTMRVIDEFYIYLPVILKPAIPTYVDLVIDSINMTADLLEVVITNNGTEATATGFWVDMYINPDMPVTGINQTWETNGGEGLAWGIYEPLAAGGVLTLTLASPYYDAVESNFSGTVAAGATVYAQVDAVGTIPYGAILELDENNNIMGPLIAPVAVTPPSALINMMIPEILRALRP